MSGFLLPIPKLQFFQPGGAIPLVGGKLYSYAAGTTTPLATYTDATLGTPNTNPIILDSNGECVVWVGTLAYKMVLEDSLGNVLWTSDNIQIIPNGSIGTNQIAGMAITAALIANGAVGTAQMATSSVTSTILQDGSVTSSKIPNGSIVIGKLAASTAIQFVETSDPRFGDGPTAFPKKPWAAPVLIGNPASPAIGDGQAVAWSPNGKILGVAENNSEVFALFSRFGTLLTRMANPTAMSVFPGDTIALSPDGQYLAVSSGNVSCANVYLYQRQGNSWGALLPLPILLAHGVTGLSWSPDGRYLAATFNQTPFVHVWALSDIGLPWGIRYESSNGQSVGSSHILNYETKVWDGMSAVSTGSGWIFVAYREGIHRFNAAAVEIFTSGSANPVTLQLLYTNGITLGSTTYTIDFRSYAAGTGASAFLAGSIEIYMAPGDFVSMIFNPTAVGTLSTTITNNWVTVTEGSQYEVLNSFSVVTNPSTLPAGNAQCCAWSPDGNTLAVGHATTPFLTVYQRVGTVLTKISDPSTLPQAEVLSLDWSPDGTMLTCVGGTSPFIRTYQYSEVSATLTALPDLTGSNIPTAQGNGVKYSPGGDLLAIAENATPYVEIYSVSGTTFTKLAAPTALPAGIGKSVSWTPDGQYLTVGFVGSPYMLTYQTTGVNGTNAVTYVNEVTLV